MKKYPTYTTVTNLMSNQTKKMNLIPKYEKTLTITASDISSKNLKSNCNIPYTNILKSIVNIYL